MTIDNKEWLKSINDFALLGLKFLYLSNAGAVIAILANINNFVDEDEFPVISSGLSLFVWGLIFAVISNFFGYLMYRDLLISSINQRNSKCEAIFGILAICSAVLSLFFFGYGAHNVISVIE